MAISDVQQALLSVGTIASQNMSAVSIDGSDDVLTQTHWYGPAGFGVHTTEVVFSADPNDTNGTLILYSVVNQNGVATTPVEATILGYDANYVLLQDHNGTDLLVANAGQLSASDSALFPISDISAYTASAGSYSAPPAYPTVVCFVAGTRIRTERGEIAVEDLVEGDRVHVLDGEREATRPVTWIGYRDINLATHSDPEEMRPIRIRQNAFGPGMPTRDLLVSPPHAIFTGGHLIPARLLVNGASITRDKRLTKFRYYHVELDQHAILYSEGMTTESYLESGNRSFFQNGGVIDLNAGFPRMSPAELYETMACAPLVQEPGAVRPVWEAILERATEIGYVPPAVETTTDPDPRIGVGDLEIRPIGHVEGRYTFVLPPFRSDVRLITRATRPSETRPLIAEHRTLGVTVSQITLQGRDIETLPLDGDMFGRGWWDVEQDGDRMWRWTNGDAALRLPAARGASRILEITIGGGMTYAVAATDEAMPEPADMPIPAKVA